jgi:uncharacterized membrane protein YhhN
VRAFFLFVFFVATAIQVSFPWHQVYLAHVASKPMVVLSLLAYYLAGESARTRSALFVAALLLSWAGDVLLMGAGDLFFMLGLAAFLLSHIIYIAVYRQHAIRPSTPQPLANVVFARSAFPVLLAGSGLVVILYPHLGSLRIPVLIYAAVLVVMVLQAIRRRGRTSPASFRWVVAGALLFMVSDSLLAINRFYTPLSQATFWIMTTYAMAQFCIVRGIMLHGAARSAGFTSSWPDLTATT